MSYEGSQQHICKNGHRYDSPESYGEEMDCCDSCGESSAWVNCIDDTNCDGVGTILDEDFLPFLVSPEEIGTCDMGHKHVVKEAVYRIPTEEETKKIPRYYFDAHGVLVLLPPRN